MPAQGSRAFRWTWWVGPRGSRLAGAWPGKHQEGEAQLIGYSPRRQRMGRGGSRGKWEQKQRAITRCGPINGVGKGPWRVPGEGGSWV